MAPKRPHRSRQARSPSPNEASSSTTAYRLSSPPPNSDLHLRAEEATLISARHDTIAAQVEWREELQEEFAAAGGMEDGKRSKTRMIRWTGVADGEAKGVWIDRYDALNLLDAVPPSANEPPSPTLSAGFSDLPSDNEEMFYFDAETREEIEREKKRRKLNEGREERLRAIKEQEEAARIADEPDETQLAMMYKLHQTLLASPSPSILEIRILANHGSDPRFSFLRRDGKWREIWEKIRAEKKRDPEPIKQVEEKSHGALGLVAYGSDSDSEEEPTEAVEEVVTVKEEISTPSPVVTEGGEAERLKKEAKAERAREWAAKRKAARALQEEATQHLT
ncbi:hypothetical protein P7C70_g508, partial [Phenoliferia sp. Uapishka_3]